MMTLTMARPSGSLLSPAPQARPRWWEEAVFYEIYLASFQDGNGDGIGDFTGLTARLDYLQELGIGGVWLTPFYSSPKIDNGYDITDHVLVDPDYGTLADFDHFISEAHRRGIRVIIDIVLNHVSDQHPWFRKALSSKNSKYRDYFIFREQPNNWESFFGGSAWTREPGGRHYYHHKFAPQQVDLNWQNESVAEAFKDVLAFWMERGVDGFRFDVINFLNCAGTGPENPAGRDGKQIHEHDIDQPGIRARVADICAFIRHRGNATGKEYFLVGEVGHDELAGLAPYQASGLLDVVFNFNLGAIKEFNLTTIVDEISTMEQTLCGNPTLFFNSHDMPRSISRLCGGDVDHAVALAALMLAARGVPFLYFGEEIGMPDYSPGSMEAMRDVQAFRHFERARSTGMNDQEAYQQALAHCRDKSRLHMQWQRGHAFAGFSSASPWIGPSTDRTMPAVDSQLGVPGSLLELYRSLIGLRNRTPALQYGAYEAITRHDMVLSLVRRWQDQQIIVLINFAAAEAAAPVPEQHEILFSRGFRSHPHPILMGFGIIIARVK